MKTIEEIIKEEIGIEPGANEFTPMDYGECKRCMQKYADQESNRLEKLVSQAASQACAVAEMDDETLKDKAAIYLEEGNVSGDTMVDMNHCLDEVPEDKRGAYYLHDLMAGFVQSLLATASG